MLPAFGWHGQKASPEHCGSARPYAQALTLAALPELPLVATAGVVEALALVAAVLEAVPVVEALPVLAP